jgi:ribosome recycling factor
MKSFAPLSLFVYLGITNAFTAPPSRAFVGHVGKTSVLMAFESTEEVEMDADERMGKSIENVKKNLQTIRTGRANPSILDLVQVSYYGAPTPLSQMASISAPNAQQLVVDAYDKSVMSDIEKAIIESDLGLTPNNDGTVIRINIPQITEERRKELLKKCKAIGEDGKVAVRNVRRDGVDAVKKMEKASDIGEDESKGSQDEIQELTDKSIKEIDSIVAKKEKDVSTV